jgi:hypothetical protein
MENFSERAIASAIRTHIGGVLETWDALKLLLEVENLVEEFKIDPDWSTLNETLGLFELSGG